MSDATRSGYGSVMDEMLAETGAAGMVWNCTRCGASGDGGAPADRGDHDARCSARAGRGVVVGAPGIFEKLYRKEP